jgi:hypothetical protein
MACNTPLAYVDSAGFVWQWQQSVPEHFKADVKWLCTMDEVRDAYSKMLIMMENRATIMPDLPEEHREFQSGFRQSAEKAISSP